MKKVERKKYLHELRMVKENTEFNLKDKVGISKYNKKRRLDRLIKEEKLKSNNLVTKDTWELQFGWKHELPTWNYGKNFGKKYVDKYEYFKGTHIKRERR